MTIPSTSAQDETPVAPRPKRKYTRRAKPFAKSGAPAVEKTSEFAGMTTTDCCDACNEKHCVITGINVCGHPHKGGLQARQMIQPEVMRRYNRAKRTLGTSHA